MLCRVEKTDHDPPFSLSPSQPPGVLLAAPQGGANCLFDEAEAEQ